VTVCRWWWAAIEVFIANNFAQVCGWWWAVMEVFIVDNFAQFVTVFPWVLIDNFHSLLHDCESEGSFVENRMHVWRLSAYVLR
jgi:hypothetical protein